MLDKQLKELRKRDKLTFGVNLTAGTAATAAACLLLASNPYGYTIIALSGAVYGVKN